jgi:hypothetical protein
MKYLDKIESPDDLKKLSPNELPETQGISELVWELWS